MRLGSFSSRSTLMAKYISNDSQPPKYLTELLRVVFYLIDVSVPNQVLIRVAFA